MSPSRTRATRASKACDNCRVRRVKCEGGVPCTACQAVDLGDRCAVRTKARPSRPISSKIQTLPHASSSAQPDLISLVETHETSDAGVDTLRGPLLPLVTTSVLPDTAPHLDTVELSTERVRHHDVLAEIEGSLLFWSIEKGIPFAQLCYQDQPRLTAENSTPLPPYPYRTEFEDDLMRHLAQNSLGTFFDPLSKYDQHRVFNLYARHRALPETLAEDERALLYASLCVALHTQMSRYVSSGAPKPATREDITYFRMALDALTSWNRPSILAVCECTMLPRKVDGPILAGKVYELVAPGALFCLNTCAQAHGSMAENRGLLEMMAWQVKKLGLNKAATSNLYPPQDMTQTLFATYFYMDCFTSSLVDLHPYISLDDIDVDLTMLRVMTADSMYLASRRTAVFLQAYANPAVDTSSDEYISASEEIWVTALAELHVDLKRDGPTVSICWAMARYHWMRILAYFPRTRLSPGIASTAMIILTHAAIQIIHLYADLHAQGHINPSWPQLKRFSHCGQILLLAGTSGDIHRRDGENALERLLTLIEAHVVVISQASEMARGFHHAANALGYTISANLGTECDLPGIVPQDTDWASFDYPFDPMMLLNFPADDSEAFPEM